MNWEAIGAIGEILGAAAVFASLIYLAIQIRTSSKIALSQSEREIGAQWDDAVSSSWESLESSRVMRIGLNSGLASLSQDELMFFGGKMGRLLNTHVTIHRVARDNLIGTDTVTLIDNAVVRMLNAPGGKEWWDASREWWGAHADYVDSLIVDSPYSEGWDTWAAKYSEEDNSAP